MLTRLRRLLLRTKVRYATYAIPPKCLRRWLRSQHISHSIFILAHPDDEIFCAGLICELRRRQIPIRLVFLTRGEGACQPDLPSDASAKVRTEEACRSASLLGVDAVTFLDLPDKPQVNISPMLLRDQIPVAFQKSSLIVTHGSCGEYGHKSHIALYRAVKTAALNSPHTPSVLGMNAWRPKATIPQIINREDRAELTLDASPFEGQRLKSLQAHESQEYVFQGFVRGSSRNFINSTNKEYYSITVRAA